MAGPSSVSPHGGKRNGEGEKSPADASFYRWKERERGGNRGPARRCRMTDGLLVRWECSAVMAPLPWVRLVCRRGWFEADPGHCSFGPGPIH
jgi:hypothetical protein